ncbi:MAG: hemin ABC transporter substrate-binding protein [Anaerolineales bacterium]
MRRLMPFLCLCTLLLMAPLHAQEGTPITVTDARGQPVTIDSLERIVSASGDVTEIIYELGFYDNLVGVDSSSTYPATALEDYPRVGFARALSAEPIAAVDPTVVFCTQICDPPAVFEQLESLGIPVVIIPDSESGGLELPFQKIEMVAQALGVPERGQALAERVAREIDWAQTAVSNVSAAPQVFHFYVRGRGLQLAVGTGTPAHAMITNAGGLNAAADVGVTGYEPLSPEIILSAFPDWLLLTEGNLEASGGLDTIIESQGLQATPAVQNDQIIVMDTEFLLAMATRTGQALLTIADQLHPDMTWETEVNYPYEHTDVTGETITVGDVPVYVAPDEPALNALIQRLGFHPPDPDNVPEDAILLYTDGGDGWQTQRARGARVIVVPSTDEIPAIAAALNVPGRGAALQARLAAEAEGE